MVCGSGLKAVMLAAQRIRAGDANLVVAGGMESMSRAPFLLQGVRQGYKYGDQKTVDALIHDGLWCPFENCAMGESAEYIAAKCGVSRADQDRFSCPEPPACRGGVGGWCVRERDRARSRPRRGGKKPAPPVERDEGIRPETTAETLAKLRPAFRAEGGTVTAGNASQLSDGAAAVVVASGRFVEEHRAKPLARIVAYSMSGVHPKEIFIAPVPAVNAVCEKAKVSTGDIDLLELNEAFAAQMLACGKELKLDEAKVNVHGGAVALGHPIGASGARVLTTLVHALHRHGKRLRPRGPVPGRRQRRGDDRGEGVNDASHHDETTAYHEAGHAVVALALDRPVHRVSVLPNRERLGQCEFGKGRFRPSEDALEREILIALAGFAAEARHTGNYGREEANRDLRYVRRLVLAAENGAGRAALRGTDAGQGGSHAWR